VVYAEWGKPKEWRAGFRNWLGAFGWKLPNSGDLPVMKVLAVLVPIIGAAIVGTVLAAHSAASGLAVLFAGLFLASVVAGTRTQIEASRTVKKLNEDHKKAIADQERVHAEALAELDQRFKNEAMDLAMRLREEVTVATSERDEARAALNKPLAIEIEGFETPLAWGPDGDYRVTAIVRNCGRFGEIEAVAVQGMSGIDKAHFEAVDGAGADPSKYGDFNLQWDNWDQKYQEMPEDTTRKLHIMAAKPHGGSFMKYDGSRHRPLEFPGGLRFQVSFRRRDNDEHVEKEFYVSFNALGRPAPWCADLDGA
jgi:hypothetical protein